MGRLIDADKLIEVLKNPTTFEEKLEVTLEDFAILVKEQPTAYDVEKVVAELENHRDCYGKVIGKVIVDNYDINLERVDLINHTIDIVKRGGVE